MFEQFPLISDQISRPSLNVVLGELERVMRNGVNGSVVEFGCYIGTTSLFIHRLVGQDRDFHVYDSFAGLPPKTISDGSVAGDDFKAGQLSVSRKQFTTEFQKAHLSLPAIHKGWFNELQPGDVPEQIAFAFLDGDFYESILDSLKLVWPRLQPGGTICFDDYQRAALPGVERAVVDYFQGRPPVVQLHQGIGVLRTAR